MIVLYESTSKNSMVSKTKDTYIINNCLSEPPICTLPDTISGTVTRKISEEDVLEFEYPSTGINAHEIQLRRIVECKADPYRETQYFRILSMDKDIDGIISVYAKHIVYDLRSKYVHDSAYAFSELTSEKFKSFINDLLYDNTATDYIGDDKWEPFQRYYSNGYFKYDLDNSIEMPSSSEIESFGMDGFVDYADTLFSSDDGSAVSFLGREIEFDRYIIKHRKRIGKETGYRIEYARNMTGFSYSNDVQRLYTDIMPYWKGNVYYNNVQYDGYIRYITDAFLDTTTSELIEAYGYSFNLLPYSNNDSYAQSMAKRLIPIYYKDSTGNKKRFNYTKILPVDVTDIYNTIYGYSEDTTLTAFPSRTDIALCGLYYAVINGLGQTSMSMSVDFVDLKPTDKRLNDIYKINLGDTIVINNPIADVSGEAECVSTKYNILTDKYESIELGDIDVTLADIISDKNRKTYYNRIIRN